VPIELPFSSTAVFVTSVDDQDPVILFPDEGEAIRRRVVARLAALGREVVPYEQIERIEAAAARGRLVLEDDRACRAPLTRGEVAERYFADAIEASPRTSCFDDCRLQVSIEIPGDPEASIELSSKTIRHRTDPRAWATAADSLANRGVAVGIIGLGLIGTSHPPPIMFGSPHPFGPWSRPPDGTVLGRVSEDVNACAHPHPRVGFTWKVRLAVADSGRIARCLASSDHTQARSQDAECLCGVIETIRYPAGRPGRRLRVDAIDDGGFRPDDRGFRSLQARTETWATRLNEAPALDVCEARGIAPTTKGITVVLDLKPDGSITGVEVRGDITTPESMAWATCLTEELPAIPLPCTPPGVQQLHLAYGPA
jgi:hypothetical protein